MIYVLLKNKNTYFSKGEDVVNLQHEEDREEEEEEDFIELSDHPALTPTQFEQKWKSLPQR